LYVDTNIQTNKCSEANRHTVMTFQYKYAKKMIGSFLEMLPDIIFSGGTTEVSAKPQTSLSNVADTTIHI